jgi:ATP-dependent helicase/nuclease subunit A
MARRAATMSTAETSAARDPKAQGIAAQVTAADPAASSWVSANAGTGKTRVLVDRISRLLLAGTPAAKILCLTFTKAAAAEMANRVNDRLGHWAALDADGLAKELAALFGRPATADERTRAPKLFAETIEAPDGLRIRTIHSFCESLLGRFPLESGLAPHFAVIDERRAAELREIARDRVLGRAGDDDALAQALDHLAGMVDEEGFAKVMAELDAARHRLAAMIAAAGGVAELVMAGRQRLGLGDDETRAASLAAASADGAYDAEGLARAAQALDGGTAKDAGRAGQIRAWLELDAQARAAAFVADYAPIYLTQKLEPRAQSTLITKKVAEADPGALDVLLAEQDRVFGVVERLKAVAVAENTEALLTVGAALLEQYERLKRERAMVDYDDLIGKAGELLGDPGDVSWVHYKLDGGIDHILVDEAQDTSPRQWTVIRSLAGDFFAGRGREIDRPRTMFAVGDEKQSIYSFQGADPALFGATGQSLAEGARAVGGQWNRVEMALSWRSVPAVLQAVDAVFSRAAAADGLSWDGHPIRHLPSRTGDAGLVELWAPMREVPADDDTPWDAPLDELAPGDPEVRLAEKIADTVQGWITGNVPLESQGRPIRAGDVLILVRSRGVFTEEMVRALKDRDIPVAGRDRMVLADHLAVMDMIAAGRFALLPDDDLNTAVVLKGPFVEMGEKQLFQLAHGRKRGLWAELRARRTENPAFAHAAERLDALLARADTMPPFEFFAALLASGGAEALAAHLGPEAADPVAEFIGLTLDFERDHVPSLEAFLDWVERGETEVKRDLEQGGGEVRVMTTHGAKGLQARIVFLADTCSLPAAQLEAKVRWGEVAPGSNESGFVLWPGFKDNEETVSAAIAEAEREATLREYRRLLYVAMTRAEDRLYVCGWQGKNDLDERCWHRLVEEGLKSLDTVERLPAEGDGAVMLRLLSKQNTAPKASEEEAPSATDAELEAWAQTPAPPEPAPTRPLSPSRPETEPPVRSPLGQDDAGRFRRGRLVHTLLQTLPELAPERRRDAAFRYLALPGHGLSETEAAAISAETLAVIEDPAFAALFGPGSRAEVPLVGGLTGADCAPIVVSGQIDRLLVRDNEILVVDFKTNRPPPTDESGVAVVYLRQMATYRALLAQIYPDRPVRAALVWTDGPRLMALSDALLDRHSPAGV